MDLTNDREFTNLHVTEQKLILGESKRECSLLSVDGQGNFLRIKLFLLFHSEDFSVSVFSNLVRAATTNSGTISF